MKLPISQLPKLDLAKAHDGPPRVFFVGDNLWNQINRPISKRFGGQRVKVNARWSFVKMNRVDPGLIIEVPFISWFKRKIDRQRLASPRSSDQNLIEGSNLPGRLTHDEQ